MPKVITWLAIAAASFLISELLQWMYRRWRLHGLSGFRRWLKDPSYRKAFADELKRRQSVSIPADVSEHTIRDWISALAGSRSEPYAFQKLRLAGTRATSALIDALSDPRFLAPLPDDSSLTTNGLDQIFDLLEDISPREAVPRLSEFIDHPDLRRVKSAALLLGRIADESGTPALIAALQHGDDHVRSYALMGLSRAMEGMRGDRGFWMGIYPLLIPLIDRDEQSPQLIVGIEPVAGIALLLERHCTIANTRLADTLAAIRRSGASVPRATLDGLLADLEPRSTTYPWSYALGELLWLMAKQNHPDAAVLALRFQDHSEERVRAGASCALLFQNGMVNPSAMANDVVKQSGFASLSEPQRTIYCLHDLTYEVCNGGLAQYLGNSSGNHAHEAIASLERVGALELALHLKDSLVRAFGTGGPARDRDKRMRQIALLSSTQEQVIESFDHLLYHGPDKLDMLMMTYALRHPDHFRKGSTAAP